MKRMRGGLEGCLLTENSTIFSFKTNLKRKAPLPFSRHGTFFDQFPALPLTLLFIGGTLLTVRLLAVLVKRRIRMN
jgi:hypothetical protein